jgi:hypothetical protein
VLQNSVPFIVSMTYVAFLRSRIPDEHCKHQRKHNRRDAERRAINKPPLAFNGA